VVAARGGHRDDQLLPLLGANASEEGESGNRTISSPTLVIWGQRDRFLGPKLAEPGRDDVPNLDRVERLPNSSHWVHHDEAERVNQLLIDFFGG
jgi:epoxide hydrolase 4